MKKSRQTAWGPIRCGLVVLRHSTNSPKTLTRFDDLDDGRLVRLWYSCILEISFRLRRQIPGECRKWTSSSRMRRRYTINTPATDAHGGAVRWARLTRSYCVRSCAPVEERGPASRGLLEFSFFRAVRSSERVPKQCRSLEAPSRSFLCNFKTFSSGRVLDFNSFWFSLSTFRRPCPQMMSSYSKFCNAVLVRHVSE